jgi:para-aminobenzoate synthetase/4-amino-4-deoxychorismate lyase
LTDIELYDALLTRQKTPYNAFLQSDKFKILSFSPELFFTLKGNKILTKPMKGTIKRGKDSFEDSRNEQFLYQDEKNRAENVMIVDLLRNDLGRIAQIGSVKVEKLFEIEKHSTLFQMTSEVSAQLEEGTTLYDIFEAIFPCGSITGAPKLSTMDVIEKIEPYNRGIYCGAIGFLSPEEVVFSVPIRILQTSKNVDLEKSKSFVYNVGGAIVWDSNPQDEWDETLTKMEFLNTKFQLIETFNSDFKLHIERMKNSASELGFLWNKSLETLEFKENTLYRIVLEKDGKFSIETPILKPRPKTDKFYVRVCGKVNSLNPFLYHKTSIRASMPSDVYDEIRTNEFGQLTEGTFTNIAVQIGEKLYTPPKSCGLLNGILRQKMLESSILSEKVLYLEDLKSADKIFCFNSVRGFVEVELC